MKNILSTLIAAVVGAVVALVVVAGQPALANQVEKAVAKNSVTSKSIKDASIKKQDLSVEVTGPLAKADSALQSIPDGSVSTAKITDNAVTSAKIADSAVTSAKVADNSLGSVDVTNNSLTADDLATNSVGSSELADSSVNAGSVLDGSLTASDIGVFRGQGSYDFPSIAAGACSQTTVIESGRVLDQDIILVSNPPGLSNLIQIQGQQETAGGGQFRLVLCNTGAAAVDPAGSTFSYSVIAN